MICKICNSDTTKITEQIVLQKHPVSYFQCPNCRFIQTEEPYWLQEAYQNAITSLDIGLVSRNLYLKQEIPRLIDSVFPESKTMIDYGGGYGLFVRMMRDLGYNFYRQDIYCENLFSKYFDITDTEIKKFDILTAFEVFEHLTNPMEEFKKMFALSENIIFSTVLTSDKVSDFENWWYVSPLTGQHISFYHIKTLEFIAEKFNKNIYSNKNNLHVFTDKKLATDIQKNIFGTTEKTFFEKVNQRLFGTKNLISKRTSFLKTDYKMIEKKLQHKS